MPQFHAVDTENITLKMSEVYNLFLKKKRKKKKKRKEKERKKNRKERER